MAFYHVVEISDAYRGDEKTWDKAILTAAVIRRRQDEAQVIKEKLGNLQKEYDVFSHITNSGLGGLA